MKKILSILYMPFAVLMLTQAQGKKNPPLNKGDFRAKQEAYMAEKAGLTQEEAKAVFPLYFELQDKKAQINDKAWRESMRGEIPLTLSIGIAHDFPDVNKLNDLANDALDIAMSRGGDQVVVSAYGQEMKFYGGKSEAQEKRNRVKTRVLASVFFKSTTTRDCLFKRLQIAFIPKQAPKASISIFA